MSKRSVTMTDSSAFNNVHRASFSSVEFSGMTVKAVVAPQFCRHLLIKVSLLEVVMVLGLWLWAWG